MPCGKLSPDLVGTISSWSQFLRSCARLGALRTKTLWDDGCNESTTVASISALPGDEESVNTSATMPQRPRGYKAGTLFSRYRLPPTHRRFLVSHSISVSIHSFDLFCHITMALRTQSLLAAFLFASQALTAPQSLAAPHVVKKDLISTFPGASPPSNSSSQKVKRDANLPSFPGYEYKSCYTDCTDHRTLQGPHTSDPGMTIEMCAAFCNGKQHRHDLSSLSLTR